MLYLCGSWMETSNVQKLLKVYQLVKFTLDFLQREMRTALTLLDEIFNIAVLLH